MFEDEMEAWAEQVMPDVPTDSDEDDE